MADRIKGITIELNGDATGLDKALKGVNSEIKNTDKELRDVDKLLKLDPKNIELLGQKQRLLTKEIDDTKSKLGTLKDAANQAKKALDNGEITQKQYDALQREIIETENKLKGLESQATQTADSLKKSGKESASAFDGKKLAEGIKNFAVGAGAALAAVGAAVLKVSKEFVDIAKDVAETGDNIDKMSQKLGLSAEAYQKWDFILQQNGANIEGLKGSMKTLATQAQNNSAAFQKLGISQEEVATLSQEDLFAKTIAGLQQMESGTERTALASQLLGRSATELQPLLNQSAEETAALAEQAEKYGLIMSNEAVAASAAFSDSLNLLSQTANGLKNRLMAEFLPSLTSVTDGLALLFTGDTSGLEQINAGIDGLLAKFNEMLPTLLEVGGGIIINLAQGIMDNIGTVINLAVQLLIQVGTALIQALPGVISTITSALLANAPILLQAAIDLFLSLVSALPEVTMQLVSALPTLISTVITTLLSNLPLIINAAIELFMGVLEAIPVLIIELVKALPSIISTTISTLLSNIPLIIKAAIELFMGILKAIPQIIIELIKSLPDIIKSIVTGLIEGIPQLIKAGGELLSGLFNGILNPQKIWESVKKLFNNIMDGIKSLFGIHSPSKVMENQVGKMLAEGIGVGFKDEIGTVNKQMAKAVQLPNMIAQASQSVNSQMNVVATPTSTVSSMLGRYLPHLADRQQIVLDTGVLVGETAPMYNRALGKITRQGA